MPPPTLSPGGGAASKAFNFGGYSMVDFAGASGQKLPPDAMIVDSQVPDNAGMLVGILPGSLHHAIARGDIDTPRLGIVDPIFHLRSDEAGATSVKIWKEKSHQLRRAALCRTTLRSCRLRDNSGNLRRQVT